jgi:hypothetical protein
VTVINFIEWNKSWPLSACFSQAEFDYRPAERSVLVYQPERCRRRELHSPPPGFSMIGTSRVLHRLRLQVAEFMGLFGDGFLYARSRVSATPPPHFGDHGG